MNLRRKEDQAHAQKTSKEKLKRKLSIKGMRVCFTGTLSKMQRSEARRLVRYKGGIPTVGITKLTDILVKGKIKWKTAKYSEASAYNIKIIEEEVFYEMVGYKG